MKGASVLILICLFAAVAWWLPYSGVGTTQAATRPETPSQAPSAPGIASIHAEEREAGHRHKLAHGVADTAALEAWVEDARMTIRGTLRDDQGRPLGGQLLFAYELEGDERKQIGGAFRTVSDGRFIVQNPRARLESPVLLRSSRINSSGRAEAEARTRWGARGVELVEHSLPPVEFATLALRVRAAETGAWVEDYEFTFSCAAPASPYHGVEGTRYDDPSRRYAGSPDQEGVSTPLPQVRPGRHKVTVLPKDPDLARATELMVHIEPGEARVLDVAVQRRTNLVVRILGGDGRPRVGTQVLVRKPQSSVPRAKRPSRVARFGADYIPAEQVLAQGQTDAEGRCALDVPPGTFDLWADSQQHLPKLAQGVAVRLGSNHLDLVVEDGAELRIRLVPRAHLQTWFPRSKDEGHPPMVHIVRRNAGGSGEQVRSLKLTPGQHSAVAYGLRAGRYELRLTSHLDGFRNGGLDRYPRINVEAGQAREFVFQVPKLRFGDVEGTITGDGRIALQKVLLIRRGKRPTIVHLTLGTGGQFEAKALRTGIYEVLANGELKGSGERASAATKQRIEIRSRERTRVQIQLTTQDPH